MNNKFTLFLIFFTAINIFAVTNYVSQTGGHVSPFNSWANAATNIQAAVNAASAGDMVLVNDGTYYPESHISVYKNIIIKSFNGAEKTIVNGSFPSQTNRCFKIGRDVVIDGLTITNGFIVGYDGFGGGVYFERGGVVQNSIISGNIASWGGGAFLYKGGIIQECVITGNKAKSSGGGIGCTGNSLIQNTIICKNLSDGAAAGIECYNNSIVQNCTIVENSADSDGGGVRSNGGTVRNCSIINNSSGFYGGGVKCSDNDCLVENCIISNNVAQNGGGVSIGENDFIIGCLIINNSAYNIGGGAVSFVNGTVENCVIYNNSAKEYGGVFFLENGALMNSILWNNANSNYFSDESKDLYNCIENWTNIVNGIITNNPKFRDAAAGNYRLEEFSPCRNTGTNMPWMLTATDLDGNPRITGGRVDMGAYEFIPEPCLFIIYNLIFIIYYRRKFKS